MVVRSRLKVRRSRSCEDLVHLPTVPVPKSPCHCRPPCPVSDFVGRSRPVDRAEALRWNESADNGSVPMSVTISSQPSSMGLVGSAHLPPISLDSCLGLDSLEPANRCAGDCSAALCNRIEEATLVKVLSTLQQLTAKLDADADPPEVIQKCRAIQACLDTVAAIKRSRQGHEPHYSPPGFMETVEGGRPEARQQSWFAASTTTTTRQAESSAVGENRTYSSSSEDGQLNSQPYQSSHATERD